MTIEDIRYAGSSSYIYSSVSIKNKRTGQEDSGKGSTIDVLEGQDVLAITGYIRDLGYITTVYKQAGYRDDQIPQYVNSYFKYDLTYGTPTRSILVTKADGILQSTVQSLPVNGYANYYAEILLPQDVKYDPVSLRLVAYIQLSSTSETDIGSFSVNLRPILVPVFRIDHRPLRFPVYMI